MSHFKTISATRHMDSKNTSPCDRCGKDRKRSAIRIRKDGLALCSECGKDTEYIRLHREHTGYVHEKHGRPKVAA